MNLLSAIFIFTNSIFGYGILTFKAFIRKHLHKAYEKCVLSQLLDKIQNFNFVHAVICFHCLWPGAS